MLPVLALAGAASLAYGKYQSGKEAQAAAEFNAAVSRANAQAVLNANEIDVFQMKRQAKRLMGTQRARYAKSGVKMEGSALDVLIESAAEAELDQFISKYNAKIQSEQLMGQASQEIKMGKAYKRQGQFGAAGTLLSTMSDYWGAK